MIKNISITTLLIISLLILSCENNSKSPLHSFKLSDVKINGGPFYVAQQADLNYILELDQDRLLAPFLKDAGIKPIKDNYTNWENTGLDGHIGGHYLSALSFMYAATGNEELLERLNYMIKWLGRCQNKNGNGYVGGIPHGQKIWQEISEGNINAGTFSLNDRWVPLYNIHKIFAGLYDAYSVADIEEAKSILIKLTDWFYEITKDLSDEQIQTILISEHGGLNDVFVDVANLTGDAKYLEMAKRFSHRAILDPLLEGKNELTGLHANTQIPKVIGYEKYAQANNNIEWADASAFFWETIINKWTISIGGNSVREHFHPADDFSSMVESEQGPETCNTYNMLKLTRLLFLANPEIKYIDYYERALFNHILSTEHPTKGGFVYFTPMRPRHYRVYSQPHTSFWCCVGSGIESPGKYGEMIYSHSDDDLYVNLFIASEVNWHEKNVSITQQTDFPFSESTKLVVNTESPVRFNLKIRIPQWTKNEFEIKVNNEVKTVKVDKNNYVNLMQRWQDNDEIVLNFNMETSIEFLPDSSQWVSFVRGPIVLGAITDTTDLVGLWSDDSRMGHVANGPKYPLDKAPAIIVDDLNKISKTLKPIDSLPMHFTISNVINADGKDIVLQPFYNIHEARYMVYWPVYTQNQYNEMQAELERREKEIQELNERTIDLVWPGEQQPESDHFVKFEDSRTGIFKSRHWRHAGGYFSYKFKNPGKTPSILRLTYYGADKGRKFNILINNQIIANVELDGSQGEKFIEVDYPIPYSAIVKSKGTPIEIKFAAAPNNVAGGIYCVRLMKEN